MKRKALDLTYTDENEDFVAVPTVFHYSTVIPEKTTFSAIFDRLKEYPDTHFLIEQISVEALQQAWRLFPRKDQHQLRVCHIPSSVEGRFCVLACVKRLDHEYGAFQAQMAEQLARFRRLLSITLQDSKHARTRKDRQLPMWEDLKVGESRTVHVRNRNAIYASIAKARKRLPTEDMQFRVREEAKPGRYLVTRITQDQREREWTRATKEKHRNMLIAQGQPIPMHLEPVINVSSYEKEEKQKLDIEIAIIRQDIKDGKYRDAPDFVEDFESDPYYFAEVALLTKGKG